jgi:hypothetical protein
MKKILKISGIVLIILLIILILYKIFTYKEQSFNKFEFKSYNYVFNMTQIPYLDTIVHSGLQALDIDSVIVVIKPLIDKEVVIPGDLIVKAYIKGTGFQYIIFIDKLNRYESITTLSHELIHLKQYYNKDLILLDNIKIPIWKGDTIDVKDYTYENRPWEKEAYNNQNKIASEMKLLLYNKHLN